MNDFFTVKEVSKQTGLSLETIRHYEKVALICPLRAENGYRQFNQTIMEQLIFIRNCRALGFSLEEIKQMQALQQQPQQDCHNVDELLASHILQIDEKLSQLQQIKQKLQGLQGCNNHKISQCKVINGLKNR